MSARVPDWWPRLQAVFRQFDGRPFVWGESDCAVFAAACVEAVTGQDVLGTFRGAYSSRLTAAARLRFRGHWSVADAAERALLGIGAVEIPPRFSQVGDVGITSDNVLAVRMPLGFVARQPSGAFAKAEVERAWAVAWRR